MERSNDGRNSQHGPLSASSFRASSFRAFWSGNMNGTASRFFRLGGSLAGLVVLGWVLTGQAAKPVRHGIPLPTDWSHRHMIFSATTSPERLARASKDPRYWQQLYRRETSEKLAVEIPAVFGGPGHHGPPKQRDWSINVAGSGTGAGAENYPLKYSYDALVANCGNAATPDYVVYSTGLQSSSSNASIVAFDNLYSGCPTGTVPSTYWAYDTTGSGPTPGTVMTSPIASLDGTQVAFVQTDGLGHGTVVLLKWKANDGVIGTPTAPPLDTPAQYASCATPPCMVQFDLRNPSNVQTDDQTSSIYYDFTNDIAWVGDSLGYLHQFQPFFLGTPAEVRNSTWPAVASGAPLSSPVYDSGTSNVFVGDKSGYLHAVNATTAVVTNSNQLDFGTGIIEGPVVDSVKGFVYVFASSDNIAACGSFASKPCAAVYQLPIAFTSGATGTKVTIGESSATPNPTYLGGFDSSYYNSGTATGNLYVCGTTGSAPQLFQVPITGGVPNSAGKIVATLGTAADACSPVTDVPNPNTALGPSERIFVSVQNDGFYSACGGGGCVMSFVNTLWLPSTSYLVGQQVFSGKDTETVIAATAPSSTTQPTWANSIGATKVDGGITWLDQGPLSIQVDPWVGSHSYLRNERILDSNHNVQIVTTAGPSGSSAPTWNLNAGGTTPDGSTLVWTNAGPNGTFALPAAGGSSGIISDNVVGTVTLPGASQIYFTTLSTQTCTTSTTTGVCAVQASQPALQ
jgi:hypothetical protein